MTDAMLNVAIGERHILLARRGAGERQALVVLGDSAAELREVINRERLAGTCARQLCSRELPGDLCGERAVGRDVIRERGLEVVRKRATGDRERRRRDTIGMAEAYAPPLEHSRTVTIAGPNTLHAERHDEPSVLRS